MRFSQRTQRQYLLLRMAELTLIEAIASTQLIIEAERNLIEKLLKVLPAFKLLESRNLKIVEGPAPPADRQGFLQKLQTSNESMALTLMPNQADMLGMT